MYQVILVDDEPLAQRLVEKMLEKHPNMRVVANCIDGFEAVKAIQQFQPDLVFLDIQMPKLNGFEVLELVTDLPHVIFTTAYDEFALRAFEANALDYLLKPFSQERFDLALQKFRDHSENQIQKIQQFSERLPLPDEHARIVIKDGTEIKIIPTAEVIYLEAYDDYVKIFTSNGMHLKKKTMSYYEQMLPKSDFIRIHRSFIIRISELSKIEQLDKNKYIAILRNAKQVPISRNVYGDLREKLGF